MKHRDFDILNPKLVWQHFKNIMAIPHPSGHEEALKYYIKEFAAKSNIECVEDEAGNLILRKGATAGYEDRKGVILQAHLDMVPQKSLDLDFDFQTDPIPSYIDGDWVRTEGTTLGADNGLGVAAALAILEDDIPHGDIEVLLTVSEETGLDGAFGLKAGVLNGDILLNLDTEVEGELCIGCAGGLSLVATFEYETTSAPTGGYVARRLMVEGLRGGHSGIEINEQRANANKLLFRFLRFTRIDILLCDIKGGTLNNAIPREAYVDILVDEEDLTILEEQLSRYEATIREEYAEVESSIKISLSEIEMPHDVIDESAASCIVWAIAAAPDGVYRYSNTMKGVVQTSSNLALINCGDGRCTVEFLLRSFSESGKSDLADTIASVFELADADVECTGGYPGWQPNVNSGILQQIKNSYKELFDCEAEVKAVHAGLECGIIGATYPNLDMISFGPTILSPHSPMECAQISSVRKFYKLLLLTVANVEKK